MLKVHIHTWERPRTTTALFLCENDMWVVLPALILPLQSFQPEPHFETAALSSPNCLCRSHTPNEKDECAEVPIQMTKI